MAKVNVPRFDARALHIKKTKEFFVIKRYTNKNRFISSRLALSYPSEVLGEICNRLPLLLQKMNMELTVKK